MTGAASDWKDTDELGRYELKYVLPVRLRKRLLEIVRPHVRPDPFAGPLDPQWLSPDVPRPEEDWRGYVVRTLYFDTPRLDDYRERLAEARVRHRLRARTYGSFGEGNPVYLEDKRKYDDQVIKARTRLPSADVWATSRSAEPWRLQLDGLTGTAARLARRFDRLVGDGHRRCVSLVVYARETWVGARDTSYVRFTLDYNVRSRTSPDPWELFADPDTLLIPPDHMVMELKFDGMRPAWMRKLSSLLALRAEPVTKYGLSVALGIRRAARAELCHLMPRSLRRRAASRPLTPPSGLPELRADAEK